MDIFLAAKQNSFRFERFRNDVSSRSGKDMNTKKKKTRIWKREGERKREKGREWVERESADWERERDSKKCRRGKKTKQERKFLRKDSQGVRKEQRQKDKEEEMKEVCVE